MQANSMQNRSRNLLSAAKKVPVELLLFYKNAPFLPIFKERKEGVPANSPEAESLKITTTIKNSFYRVNFYGKRVAFWHSRTDEKNTPYAPTLAKKPIKKELPAALVRRMERYDKALAEQGLSTKLFIESNRIDIAIKDYENFCDSWVPVEDCNYVMFSRATQNGTRYHRHLIIDVDDWDGDLEKAKNLYPHWLIFNPKKPGSLQVGFVLVDEITRFPNAAKSKECELFDAARFIFNKILNGDSDFVLNAAKNPLGKGILHPEGVAMRDSSILFDYKPYTPQELKQLALFAATQLGLIINEADQPKENQRFNPDLDLDFGDLGVSRGRNESYVFDPNSRNCQFFEYLRKHPHAQNVDLYFSQKNGFNTYCTHLAKAVGAYGFTLPPPAEIRATVRSVAKWFWGGKVLRNYRTEINEKRREEKMQAIQQMKVILEPRFKANPNYRLPQCEKIKIAEQLGISTKTASNYLVEVRKELKTQPSDLADKINKLRDAGFRWEQVAEMLGISVASAKKTQQRNKKKQDENALLTV